jgi:hypothetical protein
MTAFFFRWSASVMVVGLLSLPVSGCVVPGGEYGFGPTFGVGYYEPSGVAYGGWGGGYDVGPVRAGQVHEYRGGGRPAPQAYHAAPASRPIPSIPSRVRPEGSPPHGHGGPAH